MGDPDGCDYGVDMRLPTIATRAQQQRWNRAKRTAFDLRDRLYALRYLNVNAGMAYKWGRDHGFDPKSPEPVEYRAMDIEQRLNRIIQAMDRVEAKKWGIQFTAGDIDIVDPQTDMGGVLLIVAGVVVIAGLSAVLYKMKADLDDVTHQYNVISKATDRMFCKEGSPQTCAEWQAYKTKERFAERKTVVDSILENVGQAAATGSKWGLGLLIPIAAVAFLWSERKK